MLVPMASGREIVGFAHDAVGSPRDCVRNTGSNGLGASRTGIGFDCVSR